MESGVSRQQFSRRVDRAVKQLCPSFVIVCIRHCRFSFFPFSSGFAARKKKQIPFIAGSLRTGARAVKGGGVCRSLEKSGNP
jgi:hypothetical protein